MTHPHPRALEAAARAMIEATSGPFEMLDETGKEAARFEARAAIRAYLAEAGDGWRDIETAPKDGTRVLLYSGGAFTARWSEECQFGQFKTAPGWQIFECEDPFYSVAEDKPTHWMALPAPPAAQEKK
jgi:hypothetical protein